MEFVPSGYGGLRMDAAAFVPGEREPPNNNADVLFFDSTVTMAPPFACTFDREYEQVWCGLVSGDVCSYVIDGMKTDAGEDSGVQLYCSVPSHGSSGVCCVESVPTMGTISLSPSQISIHSLGGLERFSHSFEELNELHGLCSSMAAIPSYSNIVHSYVAISGQSCRSLSILDVTSGEWVHKFPLRSGISRMRYCERLSSLFCGHADGTLAIRDSRTFHTVSTLPVHRGCILDMVYDPETYTLATCGCAQYNVMAMDPVIQLLDVRMNGRLLAQAVSDRNGGAYRLGLTRDTLYSVSGDGQLQYFDISRVGNATNVQSIGPVVKLCDAANDLAISPSGRLMAISDSVQSSLLLFDLTTDHTDEADTLPTVHGNQDPDLLLPTAANMNELIPLEDEVSSVVQQVMFQAKVNVRGRMPVVTAESALVQSNRALSFSNVDFFSDDNVVGDGRPLASDWPAACRTLTGQLAPLIHPGLTESARETDFIAYITDHHIRQSYEGYVLHSASTRVAQNLFGHPHHSRDHRRRRQPHKDPGLPLSMSAIFLARACDSQDEFPTPSPDVRQRDEARRAAKERRQLAMVKDIPRRYRYFEIRSSVQSRQQRLRLWQDFDFSQYNRTPFVGLENGLANCFVNAYLHVMKSFAPMQSTVLRHLCDKQICMSCELGFLYHMMNLTKPGTAVEATNLLRTFRQVKEAAALSLHDTGNVQTDLPVRQRLQTFNRFVLDLISRELKRPFRSRTLLKKKGEPVVEFTPETISGDLAPTRLGETANSTIETLFGFTVRLVSSFTSSRTQEEEIRDDAQYVLDLKYDFPEVTEKITRTSTRSGTLSSASSTSDLAGDTATQGLYSFCHIFQHSIFHEMKTRVWCQATSRYEPAVQTKRLMTLPHVLNLNAAINEEDLKHWRALMNNDSVPEYTEDQVFGGAGDQTPYLTGTGFLPPRIVVDQSNGPRQMSVKRLCDDEVFDLDNNSTVSTGPDVAVYRLHAVVFTVTQPDAHVQTHSKAFIASYEPHTEGADTAEKAAGSGGLRRFERKWYLFNDFSVSSVSNDEPLTWTDIWRSPSIVMYIREDALHDILANMPATAHSSLDHTHAYDVVQVPSSVLYENPYSIHIREKSFTPLNFNFETPTKGSLVALDAEFVMLRPEESMTDLNDGSKTIIQESVMSLGRVSVVRGDDNGGNQLKGVPFIDDYVHHTEPVADYLTRFSGLVHGDLDPKTSKHFVTTFKSAYLKIRYLVDQGVIFVGHGLKKDFRMINILVPPEQIRDTVELFRKESSRFVSLRFLYQYFFKVDIQAETHDSIEDARAALHLYEKYAELKENGKLSATIEDIYTIGRYSNWDPSRIEDFRGGS